jgi:hypothetical protein
MDLFPDFRPGSYNTNYNLKWTILKLSQSIINFLGIFNKEDFGQESTSPYFPDDNLYDVISPEYANMPALGSEFMHTVESDSSVNRYEYIHKLVYRGRLIDILPESKYGVKTENKRLIRIHDCIAFNIEEISSNNQLVVFNFTDEFNEPRATSEQFSMRLIESSFPDDPEFARTNSIDWTYAITLGRG